MYQNLLDAYKLGVLESRLAFVSLLLDIHVKGSSGVMLHFKSETTKRLEKELEEHVRKIQENQDNQRSSETEETPTSPT